MPRYGRFQRLRDRFAGRPVPRARGRRNPYVGLCLELLEDRTLLSAPGKSDFVFDASQASSGFDLTLESVGTNLELIDTTGGNIVQSQPLALNSGNVIITGSPYADSLTIDSSIQGLAVSFNGGPGDNTLFGPVTNSAWQITGANSGTLNGEVQFANVENLTGAANNDDTFYLASGATLSGTLDGGPGGFDSLVLESGSATQETYQSTGPNSGTIDVDGQMLTYAGLEPITDNMNVANREITDTSSSDDTVLITAASTPGMTTVSSTTGAFESVTFQTPTNSLEVDADPGGSDDTIDLVSLASNFDAGLTLSAGKDVSIQTNLNLNGNNLAVNAQTIDVQAGRVISTRDVAAGANPATAASTGNSGAITFNGYTISVGAGAALYAQVLAGDTTDTPGAITMTADDDPPSTQIPLVPTITSTMAQVTITGATIEGGAVTIQTTANSANLFGDNSGASAIVDEALNFLGSVSLVGGYANSTANATVTISGQTTIDATALTLGATALTDAEVKTLTIFLGVAVGISDPTAKVTIGDGVVINTSGDCTVNTQAEATEDVSAEEGLIGPSKSGETVDITFAYGGSTVVSTATVSQGASIVVGGNFGMKAEMDKDLSVSANAGAFEDGSVGVGVAISQSTTTADAEVDGSVKATGSVTISAPSNTTGNDTFAQAAVGTGKVAKKIFQVKSLPSSAYNALFGSVVPSPNPASGAPTKLALSAAFAYANHTNIDDAEIGAGATVTSSTGDVSVLSTLTDAPVIGCFSEINSQTLTQDSATPGNTKQNSLTAGVSVGKFTDTADAAVGSQASVAAGGDVTVKADSISPFNIGWTQIQGASDVINKLNGNLGVQNGFTTSWAQSKAGGTNTAIAGSVNFFTINSTATAHLDPGANVHAGDLLTVRADNDVETVNVSGNFSTVTFFGTKSPGTSVGGSYLQVDNTDVTQAVINSGVTASAAALVVSAYSATKNISIAQSGGKAGTFGANGSFSWDTTNNNTLARIDDGAQVTTTNGAAALLNFTSSKVTPSNNSISFSTPDGLSTGDLVVYSNLSPGSQDIGGLTSGQPYYVIVVNNNQIKLAASLSDAKSGKAITLTIPSGTAVNNCLYKDVIALPKEFVTYPNSIAGTYFNEELVPLSLDSNDDGVVNTSDQYVVGTDANNYYLNLGQFVSAVDASQIYNFDGGIVSGSSTGIGASLGINNISRNTTALVGDNAAFVSQSQLNPAVGIDSSGSVNLGYNDGFTSGEPLVYGNGGGTSVGGLTDGETYYANVTGPQTFTLARSATEATRNPTFNPQQAVNSTPGVETINLGYVDQFQAGDPVVYNPNGGTSIGGLIPGQTYYVIRVGPTTIALAATQEDALEESPNAFDPATTVDDDTIKFPVDTEFTTGEAVVYNNGGGNSIGGLTDGTTYYVIVESPKSIQLAATLNDAMQGNSIDIDPTVATGRIHSLQPTFDPTAVDSTTDIIDLGYTHDFVTGEPLVYESNGASNIGGLQNGTVYYAIVTSPTSIALATTEALADKGDQESFDPATDVAGYTIDLGEDEGFAVGDAVIYSNGGGTSIGGLTNGQRYYVGAVDDGDVQLAATPNGDPIALDPSVATGATQSLRGDVFIALNSASQRQRLLFPARCACDS